MPRSAKRLAVESELLEVPTWLSEARLTAMPGHLLRRCQQRAVEIFAEELGAGAITPRQFALLLAIAKQPGLSQTALVEATGIDRSTVGDMLDRLLRRGLIRRRRSGRDQRANTLSIAPSGLALLREALPAVERTQARILAPLSVAQREQLMAALAVMAGLAAPADAPPPAATTEPARERG